jgi:hypothetical protein
VANGATVFEASTATLAAIAGMVVGRRWHGGVHFSRHAIYLRFVSVVGR